MRDFGAKKRVRYGGDSGLMRVQFKGVPLYMAIFISIYKSGKKLSPLCKSESFPVLLNTCS